jgi:hypothetical protein
VLFSNAANAPENTGREQDGGAVTDTKFQPGQSGNPNGRPAGSRNRVTLAIEALLEGEGETITRKAIELAKAGDAPLIRLCLDRLAPARKDRHIAFALPKMETAADAVKAASVIADAVASGELTPSEAADLSGFVANYAKAIEITDLEARLQRLEAAAPGGSPRR